MRRLGRFCDVREIEVREAARAPTRAAQQAEEARRLLERLPARARLVVLARSGRGWSSEELAAKVRTWQEDSRPVAIVVGGSTGLDAVMLGRADERWSLGPLTLPHELARVVAAEQLYRAGTILRGTPYHKGAPASTDG
jgi:23S rRNA (pseudouridine1915-N3)-methyltransferase